AEIQASANDRGLAGGELAVGKTHRPLQGELRHVSGTQSGGRRRLIPRVHGVVPPAVPVWTGERIAERPGRTTRELIGNWNRNLRRQPLSCCGAGGARTDEKKRTESRRERAKSQQNSLCRVQAVHFRPCIISLRQFGLLYADEKWPR